MSDPISGTTYTFISNLFRYSCTKCFKSKYIFIVSTSTIVGTAFGAKYIDLVYKLTDMGGITKVAESVFNKNYSRFLFCCNSDFFCDDYSWSMRDRDIVHNDLEVLLDIIKEELW